MNDKEFGALFYDARFRSKDGIGWKVAIFADRSGEFREIVSSFSTGTVFRSGKWEFHGQEFYRSYCVQKGPYAQIFKVRSGKYVLMQTLKNERCGGVSKAEEEKSIKLQPSMYVPPAARIGQRKAK